MDAMYASLKAFLFKKGRITETEANEDGFSTEMIQAYKAYAEHVCGITYPWDIPTCLEQVHPVILDDEDWQWLGDVMAEEKAPQEDGTEATESEEPEDDDTDSDEDEGNQEADAGANQENGDAAQGGTQEPPVDQVNELAGQSEQASEENQGENTAAPEGVEGATGSPGIEGSVEEPAAEEDNEQQNEEPPADADDEGVSEEPKED